MATETFKPSLQPMPTRSLAVGEREVGETGDGEEETAAAEGDEGWAPSLPPHVRAVGRGELAGLTLKTRRALGWVAEGEVVAEVDGGCAGGGCVGGGCVGSMPNNKPPRSGLGAEVEVFKGWGHTIGGNSSAGAGGVLVAGD